MTDYSDAVEALAESISAPDMSRQEKIDVARSILSRKGIEKDRKDVNVDLSDDAFRLLRSYLSDLQDARSAGIGSTLEASVNNAKRLSSLRDELKSELSKASSEDKELKSIASRLQDSGLGEIAGKEEHQINELGRKLEKLEERGREVEGLETRLEEILDEHGLGRSEIDSELQKRASKVSRLLADHSHDADVDMDSIVDNVAGEQALLERAEARNSNDLKDDLEKLGELYEHKEMESGLLEDVERALHEKRFDDAEDALDAIIADRNSVLEGDRSTLKDLHSDLKDSMEISSGLKKLFRQIAVVETEDKINENEFYAELADRLGLSDSKEAQQFIGNLQKDYGDMKDEIGKIESLREYSLERDKSNYEKIRQIDQEDSQLRREASSTKTQQKLKDIHEKLQELGYELENEIEIEGGEASDTSTSSDTGTDGSRVPGPDPSGEPWIVSISDIHGYFDTAMSALETLEDFGYRPLIDVDSSGNVSWAGNNYIIVFNGDIFDRGPKNEQAFNFVKELVEDGNAVYNIGNHELAAMMPKVYTLAKSRFYRNLNDRRGLEILQDVENGFMKSAVKFYDHTYVHAGMNENYDISRLNSTLSTVAGELAEAQSKSEAEYRSKQEEFLHDFTIPDDSSFDISSLDEDMRRVFGFDLREGGRGPAAGIAWLNWTHFDDSSGPSQVVGHTRKKFPVRKGSSVNANTIRKNLDIISDEMRGPSITVEKPNGELFVLTRKGNGDVVKTEKADLPSET